MSLDFNATGDYAERAAAASLGDSYEGSMCVWYRTGDSTADREIAGLVRGGGYAYALISTSTAIRFYANSNYRATFPVAANTWYLICLSSADPDMVMRVFEEDGSEISPSVGSNTYTSSYFAKVTPITIGNNDAYFDTAFGQYRYLRYWTVILTPAEWAAEAIHLPTSGAPAAKTANLYLSWPLADATDTTDWVNGTRTPTINSGGTSSEEPTIGGGGGGGPSPILGRRIYVLP